MIRIEGLSCIYQTRLLTEKDINAIFELCSGNPLYYYHCPPLVTPESLLYDMKALPPKKTAEDKYYFGYFSGEKLIAVMDLIDAYPEPACAFIGFFMTDCSVQGHGVGSEIIRGLSNFLAENEYREIRLGWVRGNLQAESFWKKNGFSETGVTWDTGKYTVIYSRKPLVKYN